MQKVKNFLLPVLLFIVFSILGTTIGFSTGRVVATLSNEGFFSSWKLLDSDLKFEQIVDVTSQIIWAKTAEGKFYSWNSNCFFGPKCKQWVEISDTSADIHTEGETQMKKGGTCQSLGFKYFRKPPGNLIECARGWYAGPEFGKVVYYALSDNGRIWAWYYSSSMLGDMVFPIFFSFGGLILGIIGFIVFMIRRRRKSEIQALAESN